MPTQQFQCQTNINKEYQASGCGDEREYLGCADVQTCKLSALTFKC